MGVLVGWCVGWVADWSVTWLSMTMRSFVWLVGSMICCLVVCVVGWVVWLAGGVHHSLSFAFSFVG